MCWCVDLCWHVLTCVNMCWPVLTQWRRCRQPTEIHREVVLLLLCCSWRWRQWWWWWPTPAVLLMMIRLLIDRQGCVDGGEECWRLFWGTCLMWRHWWLPEVFLLPRPETPMQELTRECGGVDHKKEKRKYKNTDSIKNQDTWQWSVLSWFEDTGTACCQGRSNLEKKTFQVEQKGSNRDNCGFVRSFYLSCDHRVWEVPWSDHSCHSDGLSK